MTATFPISSSAAFGRALGVAALFALLSADAWSAETIVGSGVSRTESRDVSGFRAIALGVPARLDCRLRPAYCAKTRIAQRQGHAGRLGRRDRGGESNARRHRRRLRQRQVLRDDRGAKDDRELRPNRPRSRGALSAERAPASETARRYAGGRRPDAA